MILPVHWVNGELGGTLSPSDRGFCYGDTLFETLRCHRGRLHLWDYHHRRLQRGMETVGIACSRDRIESLLEQGKRFLREHDVSDAAARLTISRGPGRRGYRAVSVSDPTLVLSLDETTAWRESGAPIKTTLCSQRLSAQPALAGIKHGNRLEQVLGARELDRLDADEGLQLDDRGQLICAVSANLFFVVGGELLTPAVDRCGIAGTVRQLILDELAPAAGIPLRIADVEPGQLAGAQELFLTNAVAGLRSVASCDEHAFTSTHWADTLRSEFYAWSESTAW